MEVQNKISRYGLFLVVFLCFTVNILHAQSFILVNEASFLNVSGTTNVADWEEHAESQTGRIKFSDIKKGLIESLAIKVEVESLKGGSRGMEKDTYKALQSNKYKHIVFQLTKVENVEDKGAGVYMVQVFGDLTIAGTKKNVPLQFLMKIEGSKVSLEGEKNLKMSDYNVEPPKALFGAITANENIVVKFLTKFTEIIK